ncbi:MAG: hypothetical protein LBS18_02150 [Clostridiales bacterium]|jgi:NAD-dependent dihydropyrimidine dehydrogenase PreA subunit|nr:hypothetical protein [Clostridiales bacterium]
MTRKEIAALAHARGFAGVFFLRPTNLAPIWLTLCRGACPPHTQGLCLNPALAHPAANCVLLLVRAYTPFAAESYLPGYYIASNAGYFAVKALIRTLAAQGHYARHIEVPLIALARQANIGTLCKNALLDIPPFGTRTALFTVAIDLAASDTLANDLIANNVIANGAIANGMTGVAAPYPVRHNCAGCRDCADACPAQAIDPAAGLLAHKCLRNFMEKDALPPWVMARVTGLLGCERCMAACRRNRHIGIRQATGAESAAFDLKRLLWENIAPARSLVGKNMATGKRLTAQAAVIAAHRKRTDLLPDIKRLTTHEHPAVRHAAIWARNRLDQ